MSRANEYAAYCNTTYANSAVGPAQAVSMHPNPGPPPTAKISIVCCMDARLDPFRMFNLSLGEAHVIRVGGGRAKDALRSLVASEHVLGTEEIMIIHHTDCGFSIPPGEIIGKGLIGARVVADRGVQAVTEMNLGELEIMPLKSDLKESVKDDVAFLKEQVFIKKEAIISGWVYDTLAGTIERVE